MGVAFKDILVKKDISPTDLQGKTLLLDAHNMLYQFLTTIRSRDGSLLTDTNGNVTSHLVGLFGRTTNFMKAGIKIAFVFDGTPPDLKKQTLQARKEIKLEAAKKLEEAAAKEDIEDMKKFASRTTRLTKNMIAESQQLLSLLGIPVIQAPSEGEAQAAYMAAKGEAYAVGSQDFDTLIYGGPRLLRNLSIAGRRKKTNVLGYQTIQPELISLSENLNELGIDQNQLIALAMLVGTDFNPGGIKGIGPKNAVKLVKQFGSDFDALFTNVEWDKHHEIGWPDVFYTIKKIPTTDKYDLAWHEVDEQSVHDFLAGKYQFSEERIASALSKLGKKATDKKQTSLSDF